jgi:hypothetical protein
MGAEYAKLPSETLIVLSTTLEDVCLLHRIAFFV